MAAILTGLISIGNSDYLFESDYARIEVSDLIRYFYLSRGTDQDIKKLQEKIIELRKELIAIYTNTDMKNNGNQDSFHMEENYAMEDGSWYSVSDGEITTYFVYPTNNYSEVNDQLRNFPLDITISANGVMKFTTVNSIDKHISKKVEKILNKYMSCVNENELDDSQISL